MFNVNRLFYRSQTICAVCPYEACSSIYRVHFSGGSARIYRRPSKALLCGNIAEKIGCHRIIVSSNLTTDLRDGPGLDVDQVSPLIKSRNMSDETYPVK